MNRRLPAMTLIVLLSAVSARAQFGFGWTISNSTTDPLSNSGPIAPGPNEFAGNLYLWLDCEAALAGGMSAAEMDVVELRGGGLPTSFSPLNGVLNAGFPTALLLAVGGCPTGPFLAGSFAVGPDAFVVDIELCLVPSAANNRNVTVGCNALDYDNLIRGFAKTGGLSCRDGGNYTLCPVYGVAGSSWGRVKSLYR